MRRIEVNQLRIPDKVAEGSIKLIKTPRTGNQADKWTKHVNAQIQGNHLEQLGHRNRGDRHHIMPAMSGNRIWHAYSHAAHSKGIELLASCATEESAGHGQTLGPGTDGKSPRATDR